MNSKVGKGVGLGFRVVSMNVEVSSVMKTNVREPRVDRQLLHPAGRCHTQIWIDGSIAGFVAQHMI